MQTVRACCEWRGRVSPTWPPTASSTRRAVTPPSSTCPRGPHSRTSSRPSTPGSARGRRRPRPRTPIRVTALLTAMRHAAKSTEIAELAVRYRDQGVAGFDIAGAEAGFPPTRHLDAFEYLRRENVHFTIHAGEAFGLPASGRRSSGAGPTGSATACGSSTTSPSTGHPSPVGRGRTTPPPDTLTSTGCTSVASRHTCGQAHPPGDVSQQQPPDRCRDRAAPDLAARAAAFPGHPQHRQPADERHLDVARRRPCCATTPAGRSRTCAGSPSTR